MKQGGVAKPVNIETMLVICFRVPCIVLVWTTRLILANMSVFVRIGTKGKNATEKLICALAILDAFKEFVRVVGSVIQSGSAEIKQKSSTMAQIYLLLQKLYN